VLESQAMNNERLENQGEYSVFPENFFSETEIQVLQGAVLDFNVFDIAEAVKISAPEVTEIKKTIGKRIISHLEKMRGKRYDPEEAPRGITIATGLAAKRELISDGFPRGTILKVELSELERSALVRTVFGSSKEQIGSYLGTDIPTTNILLKNVSSKLGSKNREQLVAIAVLRGIV